MSEIDSYKSPELDDQSYCSAYDGPYVNERGDRHSNESSSYHLSEKADPRSTNKRYVSRFNPVLKKNVRVEFFATNPTPNSFIRHAMNGTIQSSAEGRTFRSGTKDEDLFFSTILATGEVSGSAPVLFYDNPEQYERHFFSEVPQQLKDRWVEKRNAAIQLLNAKSSKSST